MDLASILRVALRALTRNKMRSSLTMLGIIIGVGAVIAMVAVGRGANDQVQHLMTLKGSNELVIQSGSRQAGVVHVGFGATKTLQYSDEQAILALVPEAQRAAGAAMGHHSPWWGCWRRRARTRTGTTRTTTSTFRTPRTSRS